MSEQHDAVDAPDVENASTPIATGPTEAPPTSPATDEPIEPDPAEAIDLDAIEQDLTDVQQALDRLNDGTYWTDEVTGQTIPDDVLATNPLARTASPT